MGRKGPITIGRIDYANVWPIFDGFEEAYQGRSIEVVSRVPSELNLALKQGELDIAAISSFAYGQNYDNYLLLPDLSVSAEGRVNSILLFLKQPLEQVKCGTIALTATSATSVNLLKIIMEKYYDAKPQYITMEPSLRTMLQKADAALLIGDSAIKASMEEHDCEVIDLGALWRSWTGGGMTFAVVAVRKETVSSDPDTISNIHKAMLQSKRNCLSNLQPLVRKASTKLGGPPSYWERYFSELNYDFGPDQQVGLALYYRYASELGLLDHAVDMQFWQDQSVVRVNE